jgi:hypothetical protein
VLGRGEDFYFNHFVMDPSLASWTVNQETKQEAQEAREEVEGWMSEAQIMKLNGYEDPQVPEYGDLASSLCATLPSRPHPHPVWASKGVLQYYYEHTPEVTKRKTSTSHSMSVQAQAKAKAEDATLASSSMRRGMASGSGSQPRGLPRPPNQPPQKPQQPKGPVSEYQKALADTRRVSRAMSAKDAEGNQVLWKLQAQMQNPGAESGLLKAFVDSLVQKQKIFREFHEVLQKHLAALPAQAEDPQAGELLGQMLGLQVEGEGHMKAFAKFLVSAGTHLSE